MTPQQLTAHLYDELPLASALGLTVQQVEPNRVRLAAPFAPNRNGHGTAFGGSLATLGILGGWAMVYTRLKLDGLQQGLVIQRSECDYHAPIHSDISIESRIADADWQQFRQWLADNGRARIQVTSTLAGSDGVAAATHTGTYVALAVADAHRQAPARPV